MLHFFDAFAHFFKSWDVLTYEQEGDTYLLKLRATLKDNSFLEIRDYLLTDGSRKYSYHWMEADGTLRRRWDNAPHWAEIATFSHHVHEPQKDKPGDSIITNIEDLLKLVEEWLNTDRNGKKR